MYICIFDETGMVIKEVMNYSISKLVTLEDERTLVNHNANTVDMEMCECTDKNSVNMVFRNDIRYHALLYVCLCVLELSNVCGMISLLNLIRNGSVIPNA